MHTCLSHMLRMAFRLERGQASAGKAFREGKLDRGASQGVRGLAGLEVGSGD